MIPVLAVGLLLSSSQATASASLCTRALAATPASFCAASELGVALAPSQAEADVLIAYAQSGEARFRTHFGRAPAPYAFVAVESEPPIDALKAAGFPAVMPFLPLSVLQASVVDRFRQAMMRDGASSLSAEAEAEIQARTATISARIAATHPGLVAHELGHIWYNEAFWHEPIHDRASMEPPARYGGPGPDWLDEAAAILMEDDRTTEQRRIHFLQAWQGTAPEARAATGGLVDLNHIMSREHPSIARATGAGGTVSVTVTAPSASQSDDHFYGQVRMVVDYLIETSGDPTILVEMSDAAVADQSLEAWLAQNGPRNNLPATTAQLQRDWIEWVSRTITDRSGD